MSGLISERRTSKTPACNRRWRKTRSTISLLTFSSATIFARGHFPSDTQPQPRDLSPEDCSRESECRADALIRQAPVCSQNLLHRLPGGEFFKNQFHCDPCPCHRRLAHRDFRVGHDQSLRHMSTVYRHFRSLIAVERALGRLHGHASEQPGRFRVSGAVAHSRRQHLPDLHHRASLLGSGVSHWVQSRS
jgi:hypothetical protein